MKATPVDQLVYECMFPKPRSSDPTSFHALLQRSLIPEVRSEVHSFYGHIDTSEAKYPGLDYGNRIHRIRLSRWPWHRRLFRAFDNLRLTPNEIANLTKWEGTRWAKERYEKEQGITIRDSVADEIGVWIDPEDRVDNAVQPPTATTRVAPSARPMPQTPSDAEDESEDELATSVGTALNQRLRERVARRQAGETDTVLDEAWEQWIKAVIESGELPLTPDQILGRPDAGPARIPPTLVPPQMVSAARAGQWDAIPDSLHVVLRRIIGETPARNEEATAPASPSMPPLTRAPAGSGPEEVDYHIAIWRRNYYGEAASNAMRVQRTAEAPGA